MDYAQRLREEATSRHARFHEVSLALGREAEVTYFLFFEGEEDPAFYVGNVIAYLKERPHIEYVCDGRDDVFATHELLARDSRAVGRVFFFVDKDDSDLISVASELPASFYQTKWYSFENYMVCIEVFRRYWVEKLHLNLMDSRFEPCVEMLSECLRQFYSRARLISAFMLIARGIDGRKKFKLNLNNINMDRILSVNVFERKVRWQSDAVSAFIAAGSLQDSGLNIDPSELRRVYLRHLKGRPEKAYIRGKFELWFFIRVLRDLTAHLSDRKRCAKDKVKRATPRDALSNQSGAEVLAYLTPCPNDLAEFLRTSF